MDRMNEKVFEVVKIPAFSFKITNTGMWPFNNVMSCFQRQEGDFIAQDQ